MHLVRRVFVVLAMVLAALVPAGRAAAGDFTQADTRVTMSDGVRIAVSYFQPTGTPPPAGWPAAILLHGLGQTRNTSDFVHWSPNGMARQFLAPNGYAVLTYDARAHGESEGLFTLDGPRELADLRELITWLTTNHPVDSKHVGAYGASYGGGLLWEAAVEGFPDLRRVRLRDVPDRPRASRRLGRLRARFATILTSPSRRRLALELQDTLFQPLQLVKRGQHRCSLWLARDPCKRI